MQYNLLKPIKITQCGCNIYASAPEIWDHMKEGSFHTCMWIDTQCVKFKGVKGRTMQNCKMSSVLFLFQWTDVKLSWWYYDNLGPMGDIAFLSARLWILMHLQNVITMTIMSCIIIICYSTANPLDFIETSGIVYLSLFLGIHRRFLLWFIGDISHLPCDVPVAMYNSVAMSNSVSHLISVQSH